MSVSSTMLCGRAATAMLNPWPVRQTATRIYGDGYVEEIVKGNRTVLSQAVTLIESNKPNIRKAQQIIENVGLCRKSVRLGITGVPGAEKVHLRPLRACSVKAKLAVLAIESE